MNKRAQRITMSEMEGYCVNLPQGTIPFTSGAPGLDAMPLAMLEEQISRVLREERFAFGYGDQAGDELLRETLSHYATKLGFASDLPLEQIVVTNGGIGAASIVASLTLEEGDVVACEDPSYPEVMDTFRKEGARLVPLAMDSEGVLPEALREAARKEKIKLVYLIPHFQNPSGARLSLERRMQIAQIAREEDLTILEDDPYRELWYTTPPEPSLASLAPERVLFTGSFSKTFAPGLRTGWLMGPAPLMEKAAALQGLTSLGAPWFVSRALARLWVDEAYQDHLQATRTDLAYRAGLVVQALEGVEGVEFREPTGGMFLWLKVAGGRDTRDLVRHLRTLGVAALPGYLFSPTGESCTDCLRLTYARQSLEDLQEGLRRLREGLLSWR